MDVIVHVSVYQNLGFKGLQDQISHQNIDLISWRPWCILTYSLLINVKIYFHVYQKGGFQGLKLNDKVYVSEANMKVGLQEAKSTC